MLAQEFRGKVGTVRPHKRVHLGAEDETPEIALLLQGLEDGTVELTGKIDLPLCAIAPAEPNDVVTDIACFHDSWHSYSSANAVTGEAKP